MRVVIGIVALLGSTTLAGFIIAIRIVLFVLLPAVGVGNATATLVGQNLGAKQPKRAEDSVYLGIKSNTLFMIPMTILLYLLAPWLMAPFSANEQVQSEGIIILQLLSLGIIFWGIGNVIIQAFNGAGDTLTPTWINLLCFWAVQIPLVYVTSIYLSMESIGTGLGIIGADAFFCVFTLWLFKKGKWKEMK